MRGHFRLCSAGFSIAGESPLSKHLQIRDLCTSLVLVGCVLSASAAWGQRAYLPLTTLSSTNGDAIRPQVDSFVKDAVTKIESTDPAAQKAGRDTLTDAANNANASDIFLDVLASSLNGQLLATKLADNKDLRSRLNAAIAVSRVAAKASAKTPNTKLEPIIEKLISDKSQPVNLWGIKAAESILPALLMTHQDVKHLAQLIIESVKDHSDCAECGTTVEEAYHALTLNGSTKGIPRDAIKGFVQYPMQLLAWRVSMYQTLIPPSPSADTEATSFFVADVAWSAMDTAQRAQALKLMEDLLEGIDKQIPQAGDNKGQLADAIKYTGQAIQVSGELLSSTDLKNAGQKIASMGNDPSPDELTNRIETLKNAVRGTSLPAPAPIAS
jgi:hypothetical protein